MLTEQQQKELESEKQAVRQEQNNLPTESNNALPSMQLTDNFNEMFGNAIKNHEEEINDLADDAVKGEIKIKREQLKGRKKIFQSKNQQDVTDEKLKEDAKKHERAKTILQGFGLVSQLPAPYRITALIIGFPFFLIYLCTVGAITLFATFVAKGFITMVADCCDRFAEVNAKYINNNNNKEFSLGKAIFNALKWVLGLAVVLTIVILLLVR